ncbi:hypothetical protein NDU88_006606, partial [Pleurodeles waltl]
MGMCIAMRILHGTNCEFRSLRHAKRYLHLALQSLSHRCIACRTYIFILFFHCHSIDINVSVETITSDQLALP